MNVQADLKVPMRDGITLSADLFLPGEEARCPAVFNMTPYGTDPEGEDLARAARPFLARGYAYAAVDVRGRHRSGGDWYAHPPREGEDGSDVISWVAAQPWSDGRVVTTGHSYSGWNQWMTAAERNPHHLAMASSGSPTDLFVDWPNVDGVLSLQPIATWALGMMYGRGGPADEAHSTMSWKQALWHLPLIELDTLMVGRRLPFWRDWLERDALDDSWIRLRLVGRFDRVAIPTFNMSGWYDARLKGQVAAYRGVIETNRDSSRHMLVIGPWLHSPMGQAPAFAMRPFGPGGDLDVASLRAAWFDAALGRQPRPDLRGLLYFLQVANEWRQAEAWPIPGTRFTRFHLDSGGGANTLAGDGVLRTAGPGQGPADRFVYDPADPVRTNWSPTRAAGILPSQPQDNRDVEMRPDVLVYSTPPLATAVEVTGPVSAVVFFSTDVPDTDITVKLVDVDAEGRAFQLSYGVARARYRQTYERPEMLQPGEVYRVEVELQPTGNLFEAGHRIRIEVSSSNFPFYARNLNTGLNNNTTSEMRVATTSIEHSARHPSHILLPIVPAGATRAADIA